MNAAGVIELLCEYNGNSASNDETRKITDSFIIRFYLSRYHSRRGGQYLRIYLEQTIDNLVTVIDPHEWIEMAYNQARYIAKREKMNLLESMTEIIPYDKIIIKEEE
jgi:hypothetical protein